MKFALGALAGAAIVCAIWLGKMPTVELAIARKPVRHICWYSPSKRVLKKCRNTCSGSGTYAIRRKRRAALRVARQACRKEYGGSCRLDYCERLN